MRGDRTFSTRRHAGAFLAGLAATVLCLLPGSAAAEPRIRDIRIEPAVLTLEPGETEDLTALAVFDDDSTQDVTAEVLFESRDEEVVQVEGRRVRAVGSGETTIRAFHPPSGEDAGEAAEVIVLEITALAIQPAESTVRVGETVQLRAVATLENGRSGVDVTSLVEWESGKKGVASVAGGLVSGLAIGDAEIKVQDPSSGVKSPKNAAIVHVTAGGGGGNPGGDPDAEVVRLWAEPEKLKLLADEIADLRVTAELEDGSTVDVTDVVSYASTRPHVATVDGGGRVTARAPGTTKIRIEHPSGEDVDREPEVWVGELEQLSLAPATRHLEVGSSLALRAIGGFDNGRSLDLTERVSWSSEDDDVLAVSNAPGTRGRLSAVRGGTTVVTARDGDSGVESRKSDGEFTVGAGGPAIPPGEDEDIRDLVFEPSLLRLRPGEGRLLRVFAVFDGGGSADVTERVQLTVRDTKVARIEGGNEVTGLRGGQTEVTAFDPATRARSRVRARIEVTRLVALSIDPGSSALAPGATRQLRARAAYDDGSTGVDVTELVTWSSENPSVATVDNGADRGLVSALAEGVAQIRAEDLISGVRSDRSTGKVVVGEASEQPGSDIVELSFEPPALVLDRGESASVSVLGVRGDGTRELLPIDQVSLRSLERRSISVGRDGTVAGRRGGVGEVLAEHSASGASGRLPVTIREVTQLAIDPPAIALRVGATANLSAVARFNDGTDPVVLDGEVTWRSDASGVATVEAVGGRGRVKALAPGVAFIQARHDSSRVRSDASSGLVQVVDELVRIVVEPASTVLEVGEVQRFKAIGQFADGGLLDLSDDVLWRVSDSSVARIDASGRLEALADGDVVVTAIDVASGRSSAEGDGDARVDVGVDLVGIQVAADDELSDEPVQIRLAPQEATRLFGLGLFEGTAAATDLSDRLEWSSSDEEIVTVGPGGLVSCASEGTATVSAADPVTGLTSTGTLGDATVECARDPGVLQIEPAETAIDFPRSRQLRAYRVFEDGSKVEITRSVVWTSSDPDVVSVVESGGDAGQATALEDGVVTISAFDPVFGISTSDPGGVSSTVSVRKTRVELRIFPILPSPSPDGVLRGAVGDLVRLRARVTYASGVTEGVNLRVEWTSSDEGVVLMGPLAGLPINEGRMMGTGQTTITARWPADETSPELVDTVEVQVSPAAP